MRGMDFLIFSLPAGVNEFYNVPAKLRFHQSGINFAVFQISFEKHFVKLRNKSTFFRKSQIPARVFRSGIFAIFFHQLFKIFAI